MHFLTDFADQAMILPLALFVCIGLAAAGWSRAAVAWAVAVTITLGSTAVAKMAVAVCGAPVTAAWDLYSPSGHTASAALVYGSLAALLLPGGRRWTWALAVAAACLIGASRLALGVHTPADVITGGAIGIAGAALLTHLAGPRPAHLRYIRAIVVLLAVSMLLFHGRHLEAESRLATYARNLWPFSLCTVPPA